MSINILQAALLGLFACLASLPGLGGTTIGNYTLGRPLVAGLVVGLIMGDVTTGIIVGAAIQIVYIALVTPGGTVSADVRAVSYIGIPLAIMAIKGLGIAPDTTQAQQLATSLGAAVGTLGTVLFYLTATINLVWQHIGWKAIDNGDLRKVYLVNKGLPWISHIICSFIPTFAITMLGSNMVSVIKNYLPMDGLAMKTLFTLGSLLPAVGIAILLKQVITKPAHFLSFFFGFTLCAVMGLNLVSAALVAGFFAVITYNIQLVAMKKKAAIGTSSQDIAENDDDEEDI
ncbi:MAG: PTS sugar transporter subunit IIC [Ethanoligenens sp.]|uniref:PTS mannose/fructose/sorbose/N-acetylgalactosamine transporter subunit IIC n=1 Tax=Ethanoligenens sp. TaxID=2099655 RepID=UPI0039EB1E4D